MNLSPLVKDLKRSEFLLRRSAAKYNALGATLTTNLTVPILGAAEAVAERHYRWITPPDGEPFVIVRSLSPEPVTFDTDIVSVSQKYDLVFLRETADGTRRLETLWVEARFLDGEIPDYFAVQTAVNGMQNSADRVDEYLDMLGDSGAGLP